MKRNMCCWWPSVCSLQVLWGGRKACSVSSAQNIEILFASYSFLFIFYSCSVTSGTTINTYMVFFPCHPTQTVQVCRTTRESKLSKTSCQRPCRPTSGSTTRVDSCCMPRWSRSWPTCAASTKSTPNSTAHCPSSRNTACSSLRWCWKCSAAKSLRIRRRTSAAAGWKRTERAEKVLDGL